MHFTINKLSGVEEDIVVYMKLMFMWPTLEISPETLNCMSGHLGQYLMFSIVNEL